MQYKLSMPRGLAELTEAFRESLQLGFAGRGLAFAIRILVMLAALGILYLRTPITFTNPHFWFEDAIFFHDSLFERWSSFAIVIPWAGYLCIAQALVAFLASFFSPVFAAAIYCYTAIFLTLTVVWLVTSPRLDMPCKPLLAISVVIVPIGYEELGTLSYIQWILPIGAFALMFMQAAKSRLVLLGEAAFAALAAFSGPFSIFLTPMFLWRLLASRGADERRMFVLAAIIGLGALAQVLVIASHPGAKSAGAPTSYASTLWVNLPVSYFMADFDAAARFHGIGGAVFGLVCLAGAAALAVRAPFRTQKIFMLLFSLGVAISGMYKFRAALPTIGVQYFYSGSVFVFWFICCISSRFYVRACLACFVIAAQLLLLPVIANTPWDAADREWPVWASYISSGLPVTIPIFPPNWFVSLPPASRGPLADFRSWTGQDLTKMSHLESSSSCTGQLDSVEALTVGDISPLSGMQASNKRWTTHGSAWDSAADGPVKLVVLVDSAGKVVGFGLPKFKAYDGSARRSKWNAIFYAAPGSAIRSYAILEDGRHICPLSDQWYFPLAERPIASARFAHAVEILPGSQIVQRFKPGAGLVGVSATVVNFAHIPSQYTIHWQIDAYSDGHVLKLGAGDIDASRVSDWQHVNLPVTVRPAATPDEVTVSLQTDAKNAVLRPAGIPLFIPVAGDKDPPVEIDGIPDPGNLQLGLTADYSK